VGDDVTPARFVVLATGRGRWADERSEMYRAALACGSVLTYEARSFLPLRGECVPCLRHGYCVVEATGRSTECHARPRSRTRPREKAELVAWLRGRTRTTVHALRAQRFTLRLIAAVEREGLVTVNLETGEVTVL